MTFTFNYRRGNQPETEFKEFEPGLDLAQLPTAGSHLNHRLKSFRNLNSNLNRREMVQRATQFKFLKFGLGMRIDLDRWNRS